MASQQIHVDYKLYKGTGLEPLLFLQLTLPLYQAIWLLITSLHHISYYQSVSFSQEAISGFMNSVL
jgi:hypothetical protein